MLKNAGMWSKALEKKASKWTLSLEYFIKAMYKIILNQLASLGIFHSHGLLIKENEFTITAKIKFIFDFSVVIFTRCIQTGEVIISAPDSSLIPLSFSQSWQLYRPICHHKKSFSAARGTPLFFFNNLGLHETSFMFRKLLRRAGRDSRRSMQQHTATVSSLRILAPTETQTSKAGGVKPWNYR